MSTLKLNQLNKQKVAERELKDIEGGVAIMCKPLDGYGSFRAQMEYSAEYGCGGYEYIDGRAFVL